MVMEMTMCSISNNNVKLNILKQDEKRRTQKCIQGTCVFISVDDPLYLFIFPA